MTTAERLALHKAEVNDVLKLTATTSAVSTDPITANLKTCREALMGEQYDQAQKSADAAYATARGLLPNHGSAFSLCGIASIYRGVVSHAQDKLTDALRHYREAEADFLRGYDNWNAQIARYAEALIYTWQSQSVKADELAEQLSAQGWKYASLNELNRRRAAIKKHLSAESAAPAPPRRKRTEPGPPEYVPTADAPDDPEPEPGLSVSWALRMLVLVLSAIVVVLVAIELFGSVSSSLIVIIALLTLGLVSIALYYILDRRLTVDVPPNCWTVLKRGTDYYVLNSRPVIRRPFDQVYAFVPLNVYQVSIPMQKVLLSKDESVELQVAVSYTLDKPATAIRKEEVMKAIAVAEETSPKKNSSQPQKTLNPADLRRGWEKRLSSDVSMTLLDVVPKHDPQDLYCDRIAGTNRVAGDLREKLDTRVQRWGLRIEEVHISDCKQLKAGS